MCKQHAKTKIKLNNSLDVNGVLHDATCAACLSRQLSIDIGTEVKYQNKMLDEMVSRHPPANQPIRRLGGHNTRAYAQGQEVKVVQ